MIEATGHKLADSIPDEDCFTLADISKDLGLGPQRVRQLIEKAIKTKHVQNLTKKVGVSILYAPQMVEGFKRAYESGSLGTPRKRNKYQSRSALSKAEIVIKVPIFDKEVASILMNKFGTMDKMIDYIRDQLDGVYKPALTRLKDLELKYEREKTSILKSL